MCGRQDLSGRVALITGGTAGIGEATALLFAREGAKVIVTGRDPERGHSVEARLNQLGTGMRYIQADVSRSESVTELFDRARAEYPRLDILVSNAGIENRRALLHELSEEEIAAVLDTNLMGTFRVMKHAITWMLAGSGGAIVTVASALGVVGVPNAAAYVAKYTQIS